MIAFIPNTQIFGTLGANVAISIADGANINGINWAICPWAGLTCVGDAALILEGSNSVKGFHHHYHGIHIPEGKTLTIKGNGYAAGIGSSLGGSCGNITITNTIEEISATKGTDSPKAPAYGGQHRPINSHSKLYRPRQRNTYGNTRPERQGIHS